MYKFLKLRLQKRRHTLDQASVPGSGKDCVSTDEFRGQRETETFCCTDGSGMTSGSREVECAPGTCRAPGSSRRMTLLHTCTPDTFHKSAPVSKSR